MCAIKTAKTAGKLLMKPPPNQELFTTLLAAHIHEIKNRCGLLYQDTEHLKAHVTPEYRPKVDNLKNEIQYIISVLVQVLTAYKSLHGHFSATIDYQFIDDFIHDLLHKHHFTQQAKQLTFTTDYDPDCTGYFDPTILHVVLDTLVYNAVDAGASKLHIAVHDTAEYLVIELHDNGPGLPADLLQAAQYHAPSDGSADIDHWLDLSTSDLSTHSTGIGLFMAQQLLLTHRTEPKNTPSLRGHLSFAHSNTLKGAQVSISIPH